MGKALLRAWFSIFIHFLLFFFIDSVGQYWFWSKNNRFFCLIYLWCWKIAKLIGMSLSSYLSKIFRVKIPDNKIRQGKHMDTQKLMMKSLILWIGHLPFPRWRVMLRLGIFKDWWQSLWKCLLAQEVERIRHRCSKEYITIKILAWVSCKEGKRSKIKRLGLIL